MNLNRQATEEEWDKLVNDTKLPERILMKYLMMIKN